MSTTRKASSPAAKMQVDSSDESDLDDLEDIMGRGGGKGRGKKTKAGEKGGRKDGKAAATINEMSESKV